MLACAALGEICQPSSPGIKALEYPATMNLSKVDDKSGSKPRGSGPPTFDPTLLLEAVAVDVQVSMAFLFEFFQKTEPTCSVRIYNGLRLLQGEICGNMQSRSGDKLQGLRRCPALPR